MTATAVPNVQNAPGVVTAGAVATDDTERQRYVIPNVQNVQLVIGMPPVRGMPSDQPPIRVADLQHKGARGVAPRNRPFSVDSYIDQQSLSKIANLSQAQAHDREYLRHYFYDQSRKGRWDSDVATTLEGAKDAPVLTPQLRAEIADRMVAQNVVRMLNAAPGAPNDGFKRLNAIGYFLAVAAAHENDTNPTAEVVAARAVRDALVHRMVKAGGVDASGRPRVSPSFAEAMLNRHGEALATSTRGWEDELKDLRAQGWFKSWPALAPVVADNSVTPMATPSSHEHVAYRPDRPGDDVHAQAMTAAAIADREAAFRDHQARVITNVRIAARRAVNGSAPNPGGPFSFAV